MNVKVVDRLSTQKPNVRRYAVAIVRDALVPGNARGGQHQPTKERLITLVEISNRHDVTARYDQHVHRRSRSDIAKGDDLVVLIDALARQFAADNATEDAIVVGRHCLPP